MRTRAGIYSGLGLNAEHCLQACGKSVKRLTSFSMPLTHDDLALQPATVATAIERIVAACRPQAVVAFGSRARGEARPDSDLDLFVLLHAPTADAGVLRRRLRALLADLPLSKDILVSDPDAYARARTQLNSVYRDIAEESLPLWHDGRLDVAAIEAVCR